MPKIKLSHQLIPEHHIDWKDEILKSIAASGSAEMRSKIIIGNESNRNSILDLSNGQVRISKTVIKKAILILGQPERLAGFAEHEIRCALCNRIISYPSWYYEVKYAVNQFHYFVCFDSDSPGKPTTKCYRKL